MMKKMNIKESIECIYLGLKGTILFQLGRIVVLHIILKRQYTLKLLSITHSTAIVTKISNTLNNQIGQNGHTKHNGQLPRRQPIKPTMNNIRLNKYHIKIHPKQTRIHSKYLRPGKVPEIYNQKDKHIETQVTVHEVDVLRIYVLGNGG